MQNKKIIILTEGGRLFGFGHISRSKAIAQAFLRFGIDSKFIIDGDDSIHSLLEGFSYDILDWNHNQEQLLSSIRNIDVILIDSIKISNVLIKKIENLKLKVIFIDDDKRRNILDAGIVIDWTVLCDEKNYFVPKKIGVIYLLGSQYTPLRKEFCDAKRNIIKDKITTILVTFGGSDVRNLTPRILKLLTEFYPEIKKNIVVGAGFNNKLHLENIKDTNTNLILNADANTMVELMQESDIAIASGGQTLYELAKVGTPTIAILLVDNAKDDTDGWSKVGSVENIGWYNDEKLFDNLMLKINVMQNKQMRQTMQDNANKYIDSDGGKLLVQKILENI